MENLNCSIPKKEKSHSLNDFRPIALTSLVIKTLERQVKPQIISVTDKKSDLVQFAYIALKEVWMTKLFLLDTLHQHLESRNSFARLLFDDFSSAFNTMNPIILAKKLVN